MDYLGLAPPGCDPRSVLAPHDRLGDGPAFNWKSGDQVFLMALAKRRSGSDSCIILFAAATMPTRGTSRCGIGKYGGGSKEK